MPYVNVRITKDGTTDEQPAGPRARQKRRPRVEARFYLAQGSCPSQAHSTGELPLPCKSFSIRFQYLYEHFKLPSADANAR